jgi:hypothetical protein
MCGEFEDADHIIARCGDTNMVRIRCETEAEITRYVKMQALKRAKGHEALTQLIDLAYTHSCGSSVHTGMLDHLIQEALAGQLGWTVPSDAREFNAVAKGVAILAAGTSKLYLQRDEFIANAMGSTLRYGAVEHWGKTKSRRLYAIPTKTAKGPSQLTIEKLWEKLGPTPTTTDSCLNKATEPHQQDEGHDIVAADMSYTSSSAAVNERLQVLKQQREELGIIPVRKAAYSSKVAGTWWSSVPESSTAGLEVSDKSSGWTTVTGKNKATQVIHREADELILRNSFGILEIDSVSQELRVAEKVIRTAKEVHAPLVRSTNRDRKGQMTLMESWGVVAGTPTLTRVNPNKDSRALRARGKSRSGIATHTARVKGTTNQLFIAWNKVATDQETTATAVRVTATHATGERSEQKMDSDSLLCDIGDSSDYYKWFNERKTYNNVCIDDSDSSSERSICIVDKKHVADLGPCVNACVHECSDYVTQAVGGTRGNTLSGEGAALSSDRGGVG